jgi:hypothetical protein
VVSLIRVASAPQTPSFDSTRKLLDNLVLGARIVRVFHQRSVVFPLSSPLPRFVSCDKFQVIFDKVRRWPDVVLSHNFSDF